MGALERIQELEFLGGEFVTWLLVETARGRGPEEWTDCEAATIEIPGPVTLDGPGRGADQVGLRGEAPLEAPELASALAEGKRVARVTMLITLGEEQWRATLDARTLEWRGVKVNVPTVADAGEYVFMRIQAYERLNHLLDTWFSAFLRLRMNDQEWQAATEAIRDFAEAKST